MKRGDSIKKEPPMISWPAEFINSDQSQGFLRKAETRYYIYELECEKFHFGLRLWTKEKVGGYKQIGKL